MYIQCLKKVIVHSCIIYVWETASIWNIYFSEFWWINSCRKAPRQLKQHLFHPQKSPLGVQPQPLAAANVLFVIIGLFAFLTLIHFNTKTYSAFSWLALVISFGVLIFVFLFGPIINDARSWLKIGPLTFQPSEFVKVILIVWYAAFFELNRHKLNKLFTNFFHY